MTIDSFVAAIRDKFPGRVGDANAAAAAAACEHVRGLRQEADALPAQLVDDLLDRAEHGAPERRRLVEAADDLLERRAIGILSSLDVADAIANG